LHSFKSLVAFASNHTSTKSIKTHNNKKHTMKKSTLTLLLSFFTLAASAQLTLQRVVNTQQKTFRAGTRIQVTLPTPTQRPDCDCYHTYEGKLVSANKDSISLIIDKEEQRFVDQQNIGQKTKTQYIFDGAKARPTTSIPLAEAISIQHIHKNDGKTTIGGLLIFLSVAHALITAPLLVKKNRSTSDIITASAFGVGLTMVLLPKGKTYYFKQKGDKIRSLWKVGG
jgi:hypothetical protein